MSLLTDTKRGKWTQQSLRVTEERYRWTLSDGTKETTEEMLWRVANAISKAEENWGDQVIEENDGRAVTSYYYAKLFYEMMVERKFMPNSPCLANAGYPAEYGKAMSACYVLPVEDALRNGHDGIYDSLPIAVVVHSSGGGTGFSFNRLRPAGAAVKGGTSSGPVSFMINYDGTTEIIKQAGCRRGANMGILNCDHPDILEFVSCKNKGRVGTNFNISVACTDEFMQSVKDDGMVRLYHPKSEGLERVDEDGKKYQVNRQIRARDLWEAIVDNAWLGGDPGLWFIDRVNNSPANPIPEVERIESPNPCGETALGPWDSCNLGSINLGEFFDTGVPDVIKINWDELERVVRLAVRFLDNLIEVNNIPIKEIYDKTRMTRRVGLGVMGWADLLVRLGIRYDSESAVTLARRVMSFINSTAHDESEKLAEVRGPFPLWSQSIYKDGKPIRNGTCTVIAPTGTISFVAGCSSGIEPLYALSYVHNNQLERKMYVLNGDFEKAVEAWVNSQMRSFPAQLAAKAGMGLMKYVEEHGSLAGLEEVPECLKVFRTAHEISPEWHVRMQAAFQEYTDNAVSKTINLPNTATREDIASAYMMMWDLGCKGGTVYRDGSKDAQVLNAGKKEDAKDRPKVKKRPHKLASETYQVTTPLGRGYVGISHDDDRNPVEVFINIGKAGSDTAAMNEGLGRALSLVFRLPSDMSPRDRALEVIDQLNGIGGGNSVGLGKKRVRSVPDAVSQTLGEFLGIVAEGNGNGNGAAPHRERVQADICPNCGFYSFVREEGCQKCFNCAHSVC